MGAICDYNWFTVKTKQNDDFRLLALIYERFIHPRKSLPWAHYLEDVHIRNLLDIGGGTGRITQNFHPAIPFLFLADFSFPMLRAAHKKNLFLETCCQVELLPYCDQAFDSIVMVDAFHHLIDQKSAMQEVLRVMKVGAIFILEEPDIEKWQVKLIALGEKIAGMRSKFFRVNEIVKMIDFEDFTLKIERDSVNYFIIIKKLH